MKILGLGVDIVNVSRFDKLINNKNTSFIKKVFKQNELKNKKISGKLIAKKFAAKEAFSKAVGTGLGEFLSFKDICILNKKSGKPYIQLTKEINKKIKKKLKTKKLNIYLSISDDSPWAMAFVILSS